MAHDTTTLEEAVLERLDHEARGLRRALARLEDATDDSSPSDVVDQAAQRLAQDDAVRAAGRIHARLDEIDDARGRLHDGSWGKCEVCDESIGAPRMEVLPLTTRCVQHARP